MDAADGPLILIVDDNETALYVRSRLLCQAGFAVIDAGNGPDGLRAAREHHPRLVILGGTDAWEICRRIDADPVTASVPVLQISATSVREEDTVRALEGGVDACLGEPVEPAVLVATVRALLRARQAEEALREALASERAAHRAKDEFLAILSHELRSPIGGILTWVTLMRAGRLDEARTARALEAIERDTRLQAKLIEDLLDVSRIVSGKMRLDVGLVDLAAVVEAAAEGVSAAADAKAVRLQMVIDPTLGPVPGDAGRLQQVVWNLLSNAVKFTPTGGRVEVRVEGVALRAEIRVTDSGTGIDAAFLPHVFERFRQAGSSTRGTEGGLGLGLAIVRHLVELHGGTVEAQSAGPGRGSIFVVRLPLPAIRMPLRTRVPREGRPRLPFALSGLGIENAGARGSESDALAALEMVPPDVTVSNIVMRAATRPPSANPSRRRSSSPR